MKKLKILLPVLVILTGCTSTVASSDYHSSDSTENSEESQSSTIKETSSSYDITDYGSSGLLQGDIVLFQAYVTTSTSEIDDEEAESINEYLGIATDFISESATEYGYEVNFIHDVYENPVIVCNLTYDGEMPEDYEDDEDKMYNLENELQLYLTEAMMEQIDIESVLQEYNTQQYVFLFWIDGNGYSVTFSAYADNDGNNDIDLPYESCTIYLNLSADSNEYMFVTPETIAHELLHTFGAVDLYVSDHYYGISKEFVKYMESQENPDIMCGDEDAELVYDSVNFPITDITAYTVGWTDTFEALEDFPKLSKLQQGAN